MGDTHFLKFKTFPSNLFKSEMFQGKRSATPSRQTAPTNKAPDPLKRSGSPAMTSSRQTAPTNKAPDSLKRSGSLAMTSSRQPPTIKPAVPSKEIKADTNTQKTGVSELFHREDEQRLREKVQQLQEKERLLREKEQQLQEKERLLQEKETREMAREFEELALQRQQPQQMIYGAEEQQQGEGISDSLANLFIYSFTSSVMQNTKNTRHSP